MKMRDARSEIETSRLILKPVQLSDAEDIFYYTRNLNVLRYTTGRTPADLADTKEFVQRLIQKPEGAFALAIRLKANKHVIGIIEFGIREEKGGVDYSLSEEYWNQGIMTEAVQAMIDWGFSNHPQLKTISSSAITVNPGSTKVMEKCGMIFQKKIQEKWEKTGMLTDLSVYVISRDMWLRQQR
jgi:ribosomal-protein-alanine N-acetyltransferase